MAGPVASRGSSTVVQPSAAQGKATVISRSMQGIKQVFFTSSDLKDPDKLYQVVSKLQDFIRQALRPLTTCPLLVGNLLANQSLTGGTTAYLNHGLGRPPVGVIVVAGPTRDINDTIAGTLALPAQVTASQQVGVQSATSGTYSFWVF
jgi:hypothetical protein